MPRFALALLLIAFLSWGQSVEEHQQAEHLLSSKSLIERAWGVYLSAHLHDNSLNDAILNELLLARNYLEAKGDSEEYAYVLAVFDALIESGRDVPPHLLWPFATRWRDEVIVLLCGRGANESDLLRMRAEPLNQAQWLAINNALLRIRSSKFFVDTLEETHAVHRFTVVTEEAGGVGGGSGGGGVGDGFRQLPKGFPPIALYQVVDFPAEGYVLLSKGPRNVFFRRTVVPTNRQVGWGMPFGNWDKEEEHLEYLAAMTQSSLEHLRQIFSPTTTIRWQSKTKFLSEATAALDAQSTGLQVFIETARQRGVEGLRDVKLRIVPTVDDRRTATPEALPNLPVMNITVR